MKVKKILITGVGGYIGSITTSSLLSEGYEVVGIDNFSNGYEQPLKLLQEKYGKKKLRYYRFNLLDNLSQLFQKEKHIDLVVHLAGVCSIDESMKNPATYFRNNTFATANLLESMKQNSILKIIFSSSCSVYQDLPTEKSYTEKSKLLPCNTYGESKLMAEKMIQWYSQLFGLQYVILRYFNVCGANENGLLGDSKEPSRLLIHNAILGALKLQPFFVTYSTVDTLWQPRS